MDSMAEARHKQVLVVRSDLGMGKGKMAVQCAHAAVSASEEARRMFPDWWRCWMQEGQAKVAVKIKGEDAILKLERQSREDRLPCNVVRDRGLTQVEPGTVTCIGIGPAPSDRVDPLTRSLALL